MMVFSAQVVEGGAVLELDPDPYDPYVFEPPGSGSGSVIYLYKSGSGSADLALDPDPSINKQKNKKINLDFYCFVTSFL
jgi:hypothetical protein